MFTHGDLSSPAAAVGRLETEKAAIHAEYEQERIAYQKLLKDFNRVELQCENLQVGEGGAVDRTKRKLDD